MHGPQWSEIYLGIVATYGLSKRSCENRDAECLPTSQPSGPQGCNTHRHYTSCCSAAIAEQATLLHADNDNKINSIDSYYAILTC